VSDDELPEVGVGPWVGPWPEGALVTLGTNAATGDDGVARRVALWLGGG